MGYSACMAVRMKDIANELGLSVVTISKVLHNHPDISPETRERVLKHVQDRDYQPNMLARSLVTGHSYLIGLVVPDLLHPLFAEVAKSLSLAIRGGGYSLIISSLEEDPALSRILKRIFGFNKVRYRGLAKNHHRLCACFALINLYLHRKRLAGLAPQCA